MNKLLYVVLALTGPLVMSSAGCVAAGEPSPVGDAAVVYDRVDGHFVLKIENKVVQRSLQAFIAARKHSNARSTLMVHEDTSVADVLDLMGLLQAAGFDHVEVFFFDQYRDRRWELHFGKPKAWNGQ